MTIQFTAEQQAKIVAGYQAGRTVKDLAAEFECSANPITRLLRTSGVYIGGKRVGMRYSYADRDAMVASYQAGESLAAIGTKYGCSHSLVWNMLRAAGVPRRPNAWRGGRITTGANGQYIAIYVGVDDPLREMAQASSGYVLEHRLVMARSLGRPLTAGETVHHINGDKGDNRLENLQLRQGKHGKGARFTCRDCGSHNVEASPL